MGHMTRNLYIVAISLSACTSVSVTTGDGSGGGTSGSVPGSSSDGEDSTGGQTGSIDPGSSTGGTGGPADGTTGSSGQEESTGEFLCILPEGPGSWCTAQLEVVQQIGCATMIPTAATCYEVVAAQYDSYEYGLAMAADCDPTDDGCSMAKLRCEMATGPTTCHLFHQGGCGPNALDLGISATDSWDTCIAIANQYGGG